MIGKNGHAEAQRRFGAKPTLNDQTLDQPPDEAIHDANADALRAASFRVKNRGRIGKSLIEQPKQ